MALCPVCLMDNAASGALGELCSYHTVPITDNWSTMNRAACDFFHRGVVVDVEPTPSEWISSAEGV